MVARWFWEPQAAGSNPAALKMSYTQVLYKNSTLPHQGKRCIHSLRSGKTRGNQRVGPHNKEVLCFLFGNLLGDSCAEKRNQNTRLHFRHGIAQKDYLLWKHSFLSQKGYCGEKVPKAFLRSSNVTPSLVKKYEFRTYSYGSLNFLHDLFYTQKKRNRIKKVPDAEYLHLFLNPLALALWAMDDGFKYGCGFGFCTNSFSYADLIRLQKFLKKVYNLHTTTQAHGGKGQFRLYVLKKSMHTFKTLVQPYWHPALEYKLKEN